MGTCSCSIASKIIFPCSGASDTGELTDLAARRLTRKGIGKMACLAGIGGKVSGIIESAKAASKILVIDGCPLECAKKTMLQSGITEFEHLKLHEEGFKKRKSEANEMNIDKIVLLGEDILACQ